MNSFELLALCTSIINRFFDEPELCFCMGAKKNTKLTLRNFNLD